MNAWFPFDQPAGVSFYLALYLLTLVVHAAFMSYVLGGSLWLAGAAVVERATGARSHRLSHLLRDWMPLALSAAITAGVAPLLFVQIVYPRQFYSANLLLGWRWMVVVPVLITAFYLLYLLKSPRLLIGRPRLAIALSAGAAICFVFVGFCWTANHLLSVDAKHWPESFVSGRVIWSVAPLVTRLMVWISGSFAVMAVLVAWQVLCTPSGPVADETLGSQVKLLAATAGFSLVVAAVMSAAYVSQLNDPMQATVTGATGWMTVGGVAWATQIGGWCLMAVRGRMSKLTLAVISLAALVMLAAVAAVREIIRYFQVPLTELGDVSGAREISGFGLFALFAVLNAGLIAFCIRLVLRERRSSSAAE